MLKIARWYRNEPSRRHRPVTAAPHQPAIGSLHLTLASTVLPEPSAHHLANTDIGEIDTSEDVMDGMGAIKLAAEEDCGFFGMVFLIGSHSPC